MQIAIYNRALSEDDFSIYKKIFETLSRYDIKPVIFEPFVEKLKESVKRMEKTNGKSK